MFDGRVFDCVDTGFGTNVLRMVIRRGSQIVTDPGDDPGHGDIGGLQEFIMMLIENEYRNTWFTL